jgi:hypothetical protein
MNLRAALALAALALGACGDDDDGESFDVQAVIEELRPGWPGLSDAELAEKAEAFRELCTAELDDERRVVFIAQLAGDGRAMLEAGCPERVAEVGGS